MRRTDRQVTDINGIREIIELCRTCHVAMCDADGSPYIVPLSFGYELENKSLALYFHCAKQGRKLDILSRRPDVCFEMCFEGEPVFARETPCNSGYYYSSLIGNGKVSFVENSVEKRRALSLIMLRQAGVDIEFTDEQAQSVCVLKLVSTDFTGKRKPRPNTERE